MIGCVEPILHCKHHHLEQVCDLVVGGVVAEGADDGAALGGRDGPAPVRVEQRERLADLGVACRGAIQ